MAWTTIEQIVLGADLSKGAFYLHLASKEEIHLALCERFGSRFNEKVQEAIARLPQGRSARKDFGLGPGKHRRASR